MKIENLKYEDLVIKNRKPAFCGRIKSLNMSSVYCELIKAAARCCKYYASDITYEITMINNVISGILPVTKLVGEDGKGLTFLFGFRESGVDCATFVKCRLDKGENNYSRIYLLRFELDNFSDLSEDSPYVNVYFERAV